MQPAVTIQGNQDDLSDLGTRGQLEDSALEGLYKPLPAIAGTKWIRVLDLQGNGRSPDSGPLRGRLRHINLIDSPEYDTLSYARGPQSDPPDTIICDRIHLTISTNCKDALVALRHKLGALTLWVDCICINQEDEAEKSTQVRLMDDIYTHARRTFCWLGPGTQATSEAGSCIKHLARSYFPRFHISRFGSGRSRTNSQEWYLLIKAGTKEFTDFFWCCRSRKKNKNFEATAVLALLDTEWLKCLWTFQEFLLSSQPVIVRGETHLEWETFYRGLHHSFIARLELVSNWKSLANMWGDIARPLEDGRTTSQSEDQQMMLSAREYHSSFIRPKLKVTRLYTHALYVLFFGCLLVALVYAWAFLLDSFLVSELAWILGVLTFFYSIFLLSYIFASILELLPVTETKPAFIFQEVCRALVRRSTSDPKDKYFAISGLLKRLGWSQLPVEYQDDLGHIYLQLFSSLLIRDRRFLSLLPLCNASSVQGPSWLPNLHITKDREWVLPRVMRVLDNLESFSTPDAVLAQDKIVVAAYPLDEVVATFSRLAKACQKLQTCTNDALRFSQAALLEELILFAKALNSHRPRDSALSLVQVIQGCLVKTSCRKSVIMGLALCQLWPAVEKSVCSGNSMPFRFFESLASKYSAQYDVLDQLRQAPRCACSLALGARDRVIYAPDSAIKGDFLVVIKGVNVPMILRKQPQDSATYSVVGTARAVYIIMNDHIKTAPFEDLDWVKESTSNHGTMKVAANVFFERWKFKDITLV